MITKLVLTGILVILLATEYLAVYKKGITGDGIVFTRMEAAASAFFFIALSLLFSKYTGILSSGYHLIDDHELLSIKSNIDNGGFVFALSQRVLEDLYGRFRPMYCVTRVVQVAIFGTNFNELHILYAIVAGICMWMQYMIIRLHQVPVWLGYIGAVIIYFGGGQSAAMWRLGPQEGIGLIMLLGTILCLKAYSKRRSIPILILCIALTALLGGTKETFLIIIPFLPALLIIWDCADDDRVDFYYVLDGFKKNIVYTTAAWAFFTTELVFILTKVNIHHIDQSYLGEAAERIGLSTYIRGIGASLLRGFLPYFVILILVNTLFILVLCKERHSRKNSDELNGYMARTYAVIILTDILVVSQVMMYSKIRMTERYLIPSTLFVSAITCIGAYRFIRNVSNGNGEGKSEIMPLYVTFVAVILMFAMVLFWRKYDINSVSYLYPGTNDEMMAMKYGSDGRDLALAMESLVSISTPDTEILVYMDPESGGALIQYLKINDEINGFISQLSVDKNDPDIHQYDVIFGYDWMIEEFIDKYGLNESDYMEAIYGDYVILKKETQNY